MFTTTCPKCKQATKPVYKTASDLPFDYDSGFFCQHCSLERLNTDSIFADFIATVEKALDAAQRDARQAVDDISKNMPRSKPGGNFGLLD